jgi:hypothetical protein
MYSIELVQISICRANCMRHKGIIDRNQVDTRKLEQELNKPVDDRKKGAISHTSPHTGKKNTLPASRKGV